MATRFVAIWFPHLVANRVVLRRPELCGLPFALVTMVRGRKLVTVVNRVAASAGIAPGMTAADARALVKDLELLDDTPGFEQRLLLALARWCVRFTPVTAVDLPGRIATGCQWLCTSLGWRTELPADHQHTIK
jgi:protein ImuB